MNDKKRIIINTLVSVFCYFILIPFLIYLGVKFNKYNIVSIIIAFICLIPQFVKFENSKTSASELVIIASMIALSVVGRIIFTPVPGFKPVTAIVIITGIAFGSEAGFITGALTALISNIFMGQGPWTTFQMFVWGFLGYLSGIIYKNIGEKQPNMIILSIFGGLGGVVFSLLMDIYTVISYKDISFSRYILCVSNSFPFMAIYAISNIIFLLILAKPILTKTNRIKKKYGIFGKKSI